MASGRRNAGRLLVLLGLALLVYSAFQGQLRVGLLLIIPFVYATGLVPMLGFLLMMVGGFLWFTAGFERAAGGQAWDPIDLGPPPAQGPGWNARRPYEGERRTKAKHGGFVLLGPIPIVWGSDKRMLPWLLLVGVGLFALMLALPYLLR